MSEKKNILVLYTELAYYTLKCFSELALVYDVKIHILKLPINKSAPFEFENLHQNITLYDSEEFTLLKLEELYESIKPNLVYCAGWTNKMYLKFCKRNKKKCPILLGFDTPWIGSLKQILGSFYAKLTFKKYFDYAFVPGNSQAILAEKMGFDNNNIVLGAYSADVELFNSNRDVNFEKQKVLIFVGRYSLEKGIKDLCDVFIELIDDNEIEKWELWCVGKGELLIPKHKNIKDFGFKQPKELSLLMQNATVFVLPSTYEPWGVVVHEFASAGFPLICSEKVGSTEVFLRELENGFYFKAGNKKDLKEKLNTICNLNNNDLIRMGEKSKAFSKKISPQSWAASLYKLLK
jgi:glycosyltransferase involved in cell wall biosynthesis